MDCKTAKNRSGFRSPITTNLPLVIKKSTARTAKSKIDEDDHKRVKNIYRFVRGLLPALEKVRNIKGRSSYSINLMIEMKGRHGMMGRRCFC